MSRLLPEQKALIRAAIKAWDRRQCEMAVVGLLFFPLLLLLGSGKKTLAKEMDLGPRSEKVFLKVLAMREAKRKGAAALPKRAA